MTLDATDVRALKNADSIVFHHRDGVGFIRAIQRAEDSSTGYEQERRIEAHMSRIGNYGKTLPDGYEFDAVVCCLSAKYDDRTQTLVRHLRAGKDFTLEWIRDNSSPVTRELGFVRDELRVKIGRLDGKPADTFLVDVYAGKDNTARMVRMTRNGVLA